MKIIGRLIVSIVVLLGVSGPLWAEDPVNIMVVYGQSETDIKAYVSAEDIRGATIAVESINARGGLLGRKVALVDTRVINNLAGKAEIAKILEQKTIHAVVGANISNLTMTVAPIFQKAGIPTISPISTNPRVTLVGDYIFRACFTDPFQGKVMARFALQDLGARTAAILVKVNSTFSTSLSRYFKEAFEPEGKIVYEGEYLIEDIEFKDMLANVQRLKPDVVFLPGHGRDSGMILKQARLMGIDTVFLGGDGWGKGVLGVAGPEAAEGNYFSNHWHMDLPTDASRRFVKDYIGRYGEKLIAASAPLAHDAVMLFEDAITRAGSLDGRMIRDALAATRDFQGITGTISFDRNGDPIDKDAVIMKYENGAIKLVKSIKP